MTRQDGSVAETAAADGERQQQDSASMSNGNDNGGTTARSENNRSRSGSTIAIFPSSASASSSTVTADAKIASECLGSTSTSSSSTLFPSIPDSQTLSLLPLTATAPAASPASVDTTTSSSAAVAAATLPHFMVLLPLQDPPQPQVQPSHSNTSTSVVPSSNRSPASRTSSDSSPSFLCTSSTAHNIISSPPQLLSSLPLPPLQLIATPAAPPIDARALVHSPPHHFESGLDEVTQSVRRMTLECAGASAVAAAAAAAAGTASSRPPLSRHIHFKSTSAVPTVCTTSAASSGATTPARKLTAGASAASRRPSMAGADLHSAADLLRQAIIHNTRPHEEEPDQIGSNSSTPPGVSTPRPDLTDKRSPGILSYFGQSTPPLTPRTRSREGKPATPLSRSTVPPTTVGPVIGKLTVEIDRGRGLRPSCDPYVVCKFQSSEYISEGPKDGTKRREEGMQIRRMDTERGKPQAIPMRSRQSSNTGRDVSAMHDEYITNPQWEHKAVFDVVGEHAEVDVSVYDRSNQEAFVGHVRFCPTLAEYDKPMDVWLKLEPREGEAHDDITGEIHLRVNFKKSDKRTYGPEDFEILKLIGKGTFGQVFQVRKKDTRRIYAMKVLSKKVIVQKKEVAHTLGERNILVRTAMTDSPFIVGLKFSFQTPTDLYLVTDYMSGGELFWHLQKEGRFQEGRAKFYIAELILALQHLHEHDIVYRDLKPENILLDANGHIALCDFGLSKANLTDTDTTNTFCGTTEYLAPEVLLDELGYTKMVDFWSLGVLVFEMCCGWSPFYAEDTQQMYKNIAFGKVRFPRDALSTEGRNFVKGLLNRNPKHRLGSQGDAEELKAHPFFADIDWDALAKKNVVPPFKPKLKSELDVSNFDPEFTNAMNNMGSSLNARAAALASGVNPASTPLSPTVQANFKGFTFVDESTMERNFRDRSQDDLDRMDEDEHEDHNDDDEWEKVDDAHDSRGYRMSGVVQGHDNDDSIFNNGGFEE